MLLRIYEELYLQRLDLFKLVIILFQLSTIIEYYHKISPTIIKHIDISINREEQYRYLLKRSNCGILNISILCNILEDFSKFSKFISN